MPDDTKPSIIRRDWCEEHNRGSLAETDGLCSDCEVRSAASAELRPCPFCGAAVMRRDALWPSEGDRDAVIHAAPGDCPLQVFEDGTWGGSLYGRWNSALDAFVAQAVATSPIDAVLFCPACGVQHIDRSQPEKGWSNPPHKTHECQGCGHLWRPSATPTNGVADVTLGTIDTKPAIRDLAAERAPYLERAFETLTGHSDIRTQVADVAQALAEARREGEIAMRERCVLAAQKVLATGGTREAALDAIHSLSPEGETW